jgi:hypothetical protein
VYGNIWALSRDKNVYRSPEKFMPDRFVDDPNVPDPRDFAFGFGRRLVVIFPQPYNVDLLKWWFNDIGSALDKHLLKLLYGSLWPRFLLPSICVLHWTRMGKKFLFKKTLLGLWWRKS